MNVIIEYTCKDTILRESDNSPMKAFMDDLFLMSSSVVETQKMLDACLKALQWSRMSFRASKSRSIVISKGKVLNQSPFKVPTQNGCDLIPSIHQNPVRFLGRMIDSSLCDSEIISKFISDIHKYLLIIDKSPHRGIHKVWILHHLLIPRARWPLLIYEISFSEVLKLERKISVFIRRWLKLHPSITNISLYSASSPCPLPLKSLTSILKSCKISGHLLLRDSKDPAVHSNAIKLKSGVWKVEDAVKTAESELEFKKILGYHQVGKAGLGVLSESPNLSKGSYEYRKRISDIVYENDEEVFLAKAVQLSLQCNWSAWCNYIKNDLSWKTLLAQPDTLSSFCIGSTYNTLPSPSNLVRWGIEKDSSCTLCKQKSCTVPHILSACKVSLKQGRYTYRHDSVLCELLKLLKSFLSSYTPKKITNKKTIKFVPPGYRGKPSNHPDIGLLHSAGDWQVLSDIESSLTVPPFLAITQLRPDIIIFSTSTKTALLLELTCPCEENMENWHLQKTDKYISLCSQIKSNGWSVHFFAIEVGARGYCSESVRQCLKRLGFSNKLCRSTLKSLSTVSIKSSFYIWLSRNTFQWNLQENISSFKNFKISKQVTPSEVNKKCFQQVASGSKKVKHSVKNIGLINKGNTCYINSILQCLNSLPLLRSNLPEAGSKKSHLAVSCSKVFKELRISKSPVDPSSLLIILKNVIEKSSDKIFDIFSQQDVPEVLEYILSELTIHSVFILNLFDFSVKSTITCHTCNESNVTEQASPILQLELSPTIQESIAKFLQPENFEIESGRYCNFCDCVQPFTIEKEITNCGNYLIIQLKRFMVGHNFLTKDASFMKVLLDSVQLPLSLDTEVSINRKLSLKAVINHYGNLANGHYTATVLDPDSKRWIHCNDRAVLESPKESVNSNYSYVLFYEIE